jgi:excisionase family DNA binding protein
LCKLFSVIEAAAVLGVHYRTVQQWCREQRVRGVRVGPYWRVPAKELERIEREGVPRPKGVGG